MKDFKVLLVDDEQEFIEALSERLKMRDMDVKLALDGEQALAVVEGDEPDVILLDLKMPGMDGMEVLRRIKKAYPHVQVVMLTGHASDKDEEQALRLGAYANLQKPVDIDRLVVTLRDAFRNKVARKIESNMRGDVCRSGRREDGARDHGRGGGSAEYQEEEGRQDEL